MSGGMRTTGDGLTRHKIATSIITHCRRVENRMSVDVLSDGCWIGNPPYTLVPQNRDRGSKKQIEESCHGKFVPEKFITWRHRSFTSVHEL